ncbi:MAG: hypothetical protein IAE99_07080 [Rhodothermales bacterium]|nr:hypothetical protein [Rhodothermales bacterium]
MKHRFLMAALVFGLPLLGLSGCDSLGDKGFSAGDRLGLETFSSAQPASRAEYAQFATFVNDRVGIVRPGDRPEVVRTLDFGDLSVSDALLDKDGYLWVATTDEIGAYGRTPHRRMYRVDPHTAKVDRAIALPDGLCAPGNLALTPQNVYVFAWRNGFTFGLGRIDRTTFAVTELSGFDDEGGLGSRDHMVAYGQNAWAFVSSVEDNTKQYTYTFSNESVRVQGTLNRGYGLVGGEDLYVSTTRLQEASGAREAFCTIYRHDPITLVEEKASEERPGVCEPLAYSEGRLYRRHRSASNDEVEVFDAETLAYLATYNIRSAGTVSNFTFVSPTRLLLSNTRMLNVTNGQLEPVSFPLDLLPIQNFQLAEDLALSP